MSIDKPRENEIPAWTVAVGNIPLFPKLHKGAVEAIDLIEEQEGLLGIHPCYPRGTILLFRSENDAKSARNVLRSKGVKCGDNICKCFVDKRYIKDEK